ncbi:AmpG family muropeptide MFS transporter [Ancylobacter rudongensis]|uniref:MFS transporter, PAT family, beta-lactamase induction signal transducer AmpG n=1 Tax=Ancylobacter rudongensis TaxID=177413 RepID=A0A1G4S1N2_9HYPH|nr:MFS transporter [Ancylobacter rudongensis]SCW62585.1 MFS transporter, PAT family, beta-lactamase induction signal transducer AmpG [Ancylobacter rudongensis]
MTDTARPAPSARDEDGFLASLAVYLRRRVLIVVLLGFSSGLPLALSGATLTIWMAEAQVNLTTIGLFALVGVPYNFKFIWAPLVDALDVPLLGRWLGRRRGWLVFTQLLLVLAVAWLGFQDPVLSPWHVAFGALLVATASATQDIVVDAFRVESLEVREQAAGMAGYVAAYRVGMLASGAGVVLLVAWFEVLGVPRAEVWAWGYLAAAAMVGVGLFAALMAKEPPVPADAPPREAKVAKRVVQTALGAFSEFLTRNSAVAILLFVVLFKFCDAFAGTLTGAFVIGIGFDKATYAGVVKGVGFAAALLGGFAGGVIARALPLSTALWVGGILQMLSNLAFSWQAWMGVNVPALMTTIVVENFAGAIGTVIFVAYISALCGNRAHTATQYALLTALAAVGRTFLASSAGFVAVETGWIVFFAITSVAALPGLALLAYLQARGHFRELAASGR